MSIDAVRIATPRDETYVWHLARTYKHDLGFLPRGALTDRVQTGRILLATRNDAPAGYVSYTHRLDGITHLPQVAVDPELWRTTLGTALLTALIALATAAGSYAITLRSAIDLPANKFWPALGFHLVAHTPGRRRELLHWALPLAQPRQPLLPGFPLPVLPAKPPMRVSIPLPHAV